MCRARFVCCARLGLRIAPVPHGEATHPPLAHGTDRASLMRGENSILAHRRLCDVRYGIVHLKHVPRSLLSACFTLAYRAAFRHALPYRRAQPHYLLILRRVHSTLAGVLRRLSARDTKSQTATTQNCARVAHSNCKILRRNIIANALTYRSIFSARAL